MTEALKHCERKLALGKSTAGKDWQKKRLEILSEKHGIEVVIVRVNAFINATSQSEHKDREKWLTPEDVRGTDVKKNFKQAWYEFSEYTRLLELEVERLKAEVEELKKSNVEF